ncbi:MAG TPA: ATPase, partial [bacterium]|nr:ATPase [bacterium]
MFIGRNEELQRLKEELGRKTACLIVCRGRRRIGKSRLIEEFGTLAENFYAFQGLAPNEGVTSREQLKNFAEQISQNFDLPEIMP